MMKDYYEVLGINENASQDEIKKAFRKNSLKHHPDKGGNPEKFKEINDAYQVLGDEGKKQRYDMERKFGGGMGGMPFSGGAGNKHMNDFINQVFGGGMGGMPFSFNVNGMNMNGNGRQNVRIFRNGVEVTPNAMQKPTPIIKTVEINIKQAFTGCKLPLEIERWVKEDQHTKKVEKEKLYVDIPQGIDHNEIIVLRGKGNIINDNNKGDIKIFIKIKNDTEFIRRGLDLIYTKTISLYESLCGFKFNITFLDDKTFTINNNDRVIKQGYEKAIPQMGMRRENAKGSLIIKFNVDYPETLTEKQKEYIKKALK